MGLMHLPEFCFITELKTEKLPGVRGCIEYKVLINDKYLFFGFAGNHKNNKFVESNKHILTGLILNGKIPPDLLYSADKVVDNEKMEKLINESIFPTTPKAKLDNLLNFLHSLQEFEGSAIEPPEEENDFLAKRLYFKNFKEMVFYVRTLISQGLIEGKDSSTQARRNIYGIKMTYEGLNKVLELSEGGSLSENCFIAMSFSPALSDTRKAIKTAIKDTGFVPIVIDEVHINNEVTINDALISEIKKCKFLVADFSQHNRGVYFEAGFALGLKRPVIYTCKKEDFKKTHFDVNHYPHIIYDNLEDLSEKLIDKIEAWIK